MEGVTSEVVVEEVEEEVDAEVQIIMIPDHRRR